MRQVAVKGDDYEMYPEEFQDTQSWRDKKIVPYGPDDPVPIDPDDPSAGMDYDHYSSPPKITVYGLKKQTPPNDGTEFVFCAGKPVVYLGYVFSQLKRDTLEREWQLDDKGHLKGGYKEGQPNNNYKDKKQSTDTLDVKAVDGSDFVYIDGIPVGLMEGGVTADGVRQAVVDGKLVVVATSSTSGEFTKCYGHVYTES